MIVYLKIIALEFMLNIWKYSGISNCFLSERNMADKKMIFCKISFEKIWE